MCQVGKEKKNIFFPLLDSLGGTREEFLPAKSLAVLNN